MGPEEKMGRLGEGAGRPRLELGLGRLAREARPRRSLGLVNASGLERFDAKQGRQQARLGLRRGRGRAATENRARRSADGAEEIRSRSGPGRDPDGRLDELMEAATLAPADDRRGGRE